MICDKCAERCIHYKTIYTDYTGRESEHWCYHCYRAVMIECANRMNEKKVRKPTKKQLAWRKKRDKLLENE